MLAKPNLTANLQHFSAPVHHLCLFAKSVRSQIIQKTQHIHYNVHAVGVTLCSSWTQTAHNRREFDSRCLISVASRFEDSFTGLDRLSNSALFLQRVWNYQQSSLLGRTPPNTHIARVFRWWNPGQFSWAWIWVLSGKLMQRDLESATWRWGDQTQPSFSLSTDTPMQWEEREKLT